MAELPVIDIDFDSEKHIYRHRGMKLPSVTQIMRPMNLLLYSGISADTLATAAGRGSRAHEQVEAIVKYGVVEFDEDTKPYIDAFMTFQKMARPTWLASEYMVYHKQMRYAGTIDLIGLVGKDDGTGVDVIDLKTTASYHPVMLSTQLGAYANALTSHGVKVRGLYGLQLLKNGKFRFERVEDGYKTFLHCLGIMNAMVPEMAAK